MATTSVYQNSLTKPSGRIIRVLCLDPAPSSEQQQYPICGTLQEVSLNRSEHYDAVSYVWGKDEQGQDEHGKYIPSCVRVNDMTIPVRRNCHDVLVRLREPNRIRRLFIDALCINQADDEEKSHQVAMMFDIYRNANHVFVWLGEGTNDSDKALDWCEAATRNDFEFLNEIYNGSPYFANIWTVWKSLKATIKYIGLVLYRFSDFLSKPNYPPNYIQDIFDREWFTRTWTIQELAIAKVPLVLCGRKIIPWNRLVDRATLGPEGNLLHPAMLSMDFLRNSIKVQKCSRQEILQSLEQILSRPVVALLLLIRGIILPLSAALFCYKVIYEYPRHGFGLYLYAADMTALLAYCLFMVWAMTFIIIPPYWVGDMTDKQTLENALIPVLHNLRAQNATDPRDKVFALFGVLNELGIKLEEPNYAQHDINTIFLKFTQSIIKWTNSVEILVEARLPARSDSPSWVPDWSQNYSRQSIHQYKAARDSQSRFEMYEDKLKVFGIVFGEVIAYSQETVSDLPVSFQLQLKARFKTTRDWNGVSFEGRGPKSIQEGDILVLISGLDVPMLLRQLSMDLINQSKFQVVGLAVVDEIMQGKAWPQNESELETFELI